MNYDAMARDVALMRRLASDMAVDHSNKGRLVNICGHMTIIAERLDAEIWAERAEVMDMDHDAREHVRTARRSAAILEACHNAAMIRRSA